MVVLDASALLAFLYKEPGRDRVAAQMGACCLSTVNLSEAIGRFVRDGHSADQVFDQIQATSIEIVPLSAAEATVAASLIPLTKPLGLSLADRACLALAITRNVPVLTTDRAWAGLDIGVPVHVIR